jgi:hypothetical protein
MLKQLPPPTAKPTQVYAASVMFGYFLRRVDRRFQLEKALGSVDADGAPTTAAAAAADPIGNKAPLSSDAAAAAAGAADGAGVVDDAVARLERLFQEAGDVETAPDPDATTPEASVYEVSASASEDDDGSPVSTDAAARRASGAGASSSGGGGSGGGSSFLGASVAEDQQALQPQRSALRRYVEGFDQTTMIETARVVSVEGAALVERQTAALFGDIKELTQQMQGAVGGGVTSAEELYARIQAAVAANKIETVTMTVATQRRCVLEAVAFGTFLRDVEGFVQTDYGLLTPLPPPKAF